MKQPCILVTADEAAPSLTSQPPSHLPSHCSPGVLLLDTDPLPTSPPTAPQVFLLLDTDPTIQQQQQDTFSSILETLNTDASSLIGHLSAGTKALVHTLTASVSSHSDNSMNNVIVDKSRGAVAVAVAVVSVSVKKGSGGAGSAGSSSCRAWLGFMNMVGPGASHCSVNVS